MRFVPATISRAAGRQALSIKTNSPAILFAAGVVGIGGTVFLACKATLKLEETVEETSKTVDKLQLRQSEAVSQTEREQIQKELWWARGYGARQIVKLYAPAAVLGVVSIAALFGSHRILNKRNAALTTAYSVLDRSFRNYRGRVREAFGEETEESLYLDSQYDTYTSGDLKGEIERVHHKDVGPYSAFFDEANSSAFRWDAETNMYKLRAAEKFANDKLQARGYLFLNEVFEYLGMEYSETGALCGWSYPARDGGDGYVDFGLDRNTVQARRFREGKEPAVILNFNCDPGTIPGKLKRK